MNHRFVLLLGQENFLSLEEPIEVLPVVKLLLELEAVVELVHLELLWVVAGQDFGIDPPVREVTLRICDLVGQVQ